MGVWPRSLLVTIALGTASFTRAEPASDSSFHQGSGVDTTSRADSSRAGPRLRMQDTVTVLRPVLLQGVVPSRDHRSSATSLRLERGTLARFLPSTIGDALAGVPGLDLVRSGAWASHISYRGLSGERVLVLVDGVRLNTGRGHGALASLVSVDRLDAVDLLPGSGGSAYGSDAMGGVVSLVTHRSLFAAEPALRVITTVRAATPGGESATDLRLLARSRSLGGEFMLGAGGARAVWTPAGRVPNSGHREDDLGGRVSLALPGGFLDLEHTRHGAYDVGLPAFSGASGASGRYPRQTRVADRAELDLRIAPMEAHLRVLGTDQRYRSDFDEVTADSVFSTRSRQFLALRTNRASDRLDTRLRGVSPELWLGAAEEWKIAGELRREITGGPRETRVSVVNASGTTTSDTGTSSESVPPSRREVGSVSASGRHSWPLLRVEAGMRFDRYRSSADSTPSSSTSRLDVVDRSWSFEGGISRRFPALEPYARVATGFRVPNLEERYFHGLIHGGLWVFGNPDLGAERSLTWEAGARVAGVGWGTARLSAYRSEVDDFITLVYKGQLYLIPRFQYRNVRRARIEGLEATAQARVGGRALALAFSLPRARDLDTGDPLPGLAAAQVTADVSTPLERLLPQGTLALRARWADAATRRSRRDSASDVFARPAFWTFALELGAGVAGGRATLAVRNLLDESYREPSSFIDEAGRTFAFSFRRNFDVPLVTHGKEAQP